MINNNKKSPPKSLVTDLFNDDDISGILNLIQEYGFENIEDKYSNNALHLACAKGYTELVESLIKTGVDINSRNHLEQTPLIMAILNDNANIVELLIENGTDISLMDKEGNTGLHYASYNSNDFLIDLLINNKDNVYAKNKDGKIPFHLVKKSTICQKFIDCGVDVNTKDYIGNTLLHQACVFSNFELIESLLLQKADPNIQNIDGNTPLHLVIHDGKNETTIIELLIAYNTNVNLQNNNGDTPLIISASIYDNIEAIQSLLIKNANINIKNNNNLTALDIATNYGYNDTVECINSYQQYYKSYDELNQLLQSKNTYLHKKPKI